MTNGGSSIINLGDLAKPATVLIEKVSNAVGVLYEPRRIRKEAEAQVRVDLIRAQGAIEVTALEQRAMERLLHQEARKQQNIEEITAQAANSLEEDAKPEGLDEDWLAHFFQQCENVSDEQMQSLWASLLAGEATTPGTFSKRTVNFVAALDRKDAELFTAFCQFVWNFGKPTPVVLNHEDEVYSKHGIRFDSLIHLDYIGLVSFQPLSGYVLQGFPKMTAVFYFGRPTLIEFRQDQGNQLSYGHAMLTRAGQELAPICGAQPNEEFYHYVIEQWYKQGLVVSSLVGGKVW